MKKTGLIKIIGYYDCGTGKHQSNTVYDSQGGIPALTTLGIGGTQQIKVLRKYDKNHRSNREQSEKRS